MTPGVQRVPGTQGSVLRRYVHGPKPQVVPTTLERLQALRQKEAHRYHLSKRYEARRQELAGPARRFLRKHKFRGTGETTEVLSTRAGT